MSARDISFQLPLSGSREAACRIQRTAHILLSTPSLGITEYYSGYSDTAGSSADEAYVSFNSLSRDH